MKLIDIINNHLYADDTYTADAEKILSLSDIVIQIKDSLQMEVVSSIDIFDQFQPDTWTFGTCYVLESGLAVALYENRYFVPYVPDEKELLN